jgi:hypothetical protein
MNAISEPVDRWPPLPDRLPGSYLLMAMFLLGVCFHAFPEESRSP